MFSRLMSFLAATIVLAGFASAQAASPTVKVRMVTSAGDIVLKLDAVKAPKTVKNFLQYVDEGFYNGTIFHRVIPTFMIQGGGFTPDLQRKNTHAPIHNEATNGLHNDRGTIAMARTNDPHSATSQFFINVADNGPLNHSGQFSSQAWGYAVFGKVVEGMDVVDKIKDVETGVAGGMRDVPKQVVLIKSIERVAGAVPASK